MTSVQLPTEVQQKIVAAYRKFRSRVRHAKQAHRGTVTRVLKAVDDRHVDDLHRKIQKV